MKAPETALAYSGKIYFQKDARSGMKVLAIGTKKTRDRDLPCIERYLRKEDRTDE